MTRIEDGLIRNIADASRRAWILVAAGLFSVAGSVFFAISVDTSRPATWASFPWHVALLLTLGANLALAGANADGFRYRNNPAKLWRDGSSALGAMILAIGIPAAVAIYLGRTIGDAARFGLGGVLALQILNTATRFICRGTSSS